MLVQEDRRVREHVLVGVLLGSYSYSRWVCRYLTNSCIFPVLSAANSQLKLEEDFRGSDFLCCVLLLHVSEVKVGILCGFH